MLSIKVITAVLFLAVHTDFHLASGSVSLLGAGSGPSSVVECSNSLDFFDNCNSQFLTIL